MHSKSLAALLLAVSLSLGSCTEPGQSSTEKELQMLRSELKNLKKMRYELDLLKSDIDVLKQKVLRKERDKAAIRDSFLPAENSYLDDPYLGNKDAPLVMMAFLDYQCRPCRNFVEETLPLLKLNYIDTGAVRFIVRDFPLGIHPHAAEAAKFANCAGEQGKYWEMFDALFENESAVDSGDLTTIATTLTGTDFKQLKNCSSKDKFSSEIRSDIESGKSAGVKGAPGFFLAPNNPKKQLKGVLIRGAQPYAVIKAEIEKLLPH